LSAAFAQVFSSELAPVHAKNQGIAAKKIPSGLSLDDWIGEQWPESESEDEDMENISDVDPNDWFPAEPTKKLSPEEKEEMKQKREQRKRQREGDPFMLQDSSTNNDTRDDDLGEDHRPTTEEINKIPIEVDNKTTLGVRVSKGILPAKSKRSKVVYSVKRGPKLTSVETEEKQPVNVHDPLTEVIDWNKPMEEEMPHLQPYKRDDTNLQSIKDAIVKKYTEQAMAEQNTQGMKKGKKVKGKGKIKGKGKNKDKAKGKDTNKNKEKEKEKDKEKNKTKPKEKEKKSRKKVQENGSTEPNNTDKPSTAPVEHNLLDDLFGDLSSPANTTTNSQTTMAETQTNESNKKTAKKSGKKPSGKKNKETEEKIEIELLPDIHEVEPLGLFDATGNDKTTEENSSPKNKKKQKSDKPKEKKSKSTSKSKKDPKKIKKEKGKVDK